jgi:hypothetical protein
MNVPILFILFISKDIECRGSLSKCLFSFFRSGGSSFSSCGFLGIGILPKRKNNVSNEN